MLEIMRVYALSRFPGDSEPEDIRRRHAQYYLAAAQHLNAAMNTPFFEFSCTIHGTMLEALREKLGETAFQEVHEEDAAMDLEQAICTDWRR